MRLGEGSWESRPYPQPASVCYSAVWSLFYQESHRDPEAVRETSTVFHLFGDIPRAQGPLLPPCLLSQMHPAVATATEERPGSGVSSVP